MSRAISTVVDVTIALLLISASVVVLFYAVEDTSEPAYEPEQADHTAQTLASLTADVTYSLEPIADDDGSAVCASSCDLFREGEVDDNVDSYSRSVHGSAPALLADATVTDATFPQASGPDATLTLAGSEYQTQLEGDLAGRLTGANNRTQIVAVWRPYDGGSIDGKTTVGPAPPANADVSTARLTVPSGVPSVDDDRLERQYRLEGFAGAASVLADTIIQGFFHPEKTQIALEGTGMTRERVLYRYRRAGKMYGVSWSLGVLSEGPLTRYDADAREANDRLASAMARTIETDLDATYSDDTTATDLADAVSTGEVTILIRTWNT